MAKTQYMRINTRVTHENNTWLDNYALENGLSKSALINLAIELFIQQKEGQQNGGNQNVIQQIERLEELIRQMVDQKHD